MVRSLPRSPGGVIRDDSLHPTQRAVGVEPRIESVEKALRFHRAWRQVRSVFVSLDLAKSSLANDDPSGLGEDGGAQLVPIFALDRSISHGRYRLS